MYKSPLIPIIYFYKSPIWFYIFDFSIYYHSFMQIAFRYIKSLVHLLIFSLSFVIHSYYTIFFLFLQIFYFFFCQISPFTVFLSLLHQHYLSVLYAKLLHFFRIASHILLTCLFFPSCIVISILDIFFSSSTFKIFTAAGLVIYSPISTPVFNFSISSFVTFPPSVTVYVLVISCFGCVTLYTNSPVVC